MLRAYILTCVLVAAQRSKEEDEDMVVDRTESRDDANPEAASTEGLTFDDTSEFVRSVGNNPIVVKKEPKEIIPAPASSSRQRRSVSRDVSMAPGDEALEELEAGEVPIKDEEEDDYDMDMLNAIEDVLKTTEAEGATADDGVGGTSSEQTLQFRHGIYSEHTTATRHTFYSECGCEGSRKNAASTRSVACRSTSSRSSAGDGKTAVARR